LIWFSAFYGYDQMRQYVHALRHSSEARAFQKIATGLQIFAWGMVLSTMLSTLLGIVRSRAEWFAPTQAVTNHYASLIIALAAFTLIGDGTYMLFGMVKARRTKLAMRGLILCSIVVGLFFMRLVLMNWRNNGNPYYLPIYPLILTFIVPYIYAWVVGAIAVIELRTYARLSSGVLYRNALQLLATGLIIVILVSIAAQYITAAFANGQGASLGTILFAVYTLLAIEALGFIMVAFGAKRMKRIEEV
jgi:hypothetical protein